jgi:hypothetical protein
MEIPDFHGELIAPDHPGYDDARAVWNGTVDRRPRLIARCTGAADVASAVRFARDRDVEIAVRGGGHNVAGTAVCDGGIVIDLSAMRAVTVDPAARTARVQGGALWADVDHETQAHGLATTGGIVGPTVVAGPVFWAAEDTTAVLRYYREFAAGAPDELGNVVRLGTIPPLPAVPPELHFRPAIAVGCCYAGPVSDGLQAVGPLRRFGTPLVDLVGPTLYVDHQRSTDDTVPHGWHYYWKATNLAALSDEVIDVVATHAYRARSPRSYSAMFHFGGAVARVPRDATAYPDRDVAHNIIIDAVWLPPERHTVGRSETAWAREFLRALAPHRAGVYVNFLDADDDSARVREAYGDDTYERLARVKAGYDPDNVFRHNQNIRPHAVADQPG